MSSDLIIVGCVMLNAPRAVLRSLVGNSEGRIPAACDPFEVPIIRTLRGTDYIGDTNIDQRYAERNGFTYFYPDTSMDHLWIQAAT
jgi:hypothetical protein